MDALDATAAGLSLLILDDQPADIIFTLVELQSAGILHRLRPCVCWVSDQGSSVGLARILKHLANDPALVPTEHKAAVRDCVCRAADDDRLLELVVPDSAALPRAVGGLTAFVETNNCGLALVDLALDKQGERFGGGLLISWVMKESSLWGVVYHTGELPNILLQEMCRFESPPWLRRLTTHSALVTRKRVVDQGRDATTRQHKGYNWYKPQEVARAVLYIIAEARDRALWLLDSLTDAERHRAYYIFTGHKEADQFHHFLDHHRQTRDEFLAAWGAVAYEPIRPGEPLSKLATLMGLGLTDEQLPGLYEIRDRCHSYLECSDSLGRDATISQVERHFDLLFGPPALDRVIAMVTEQARAMGAQYSMDVGMQVSVEHPDRQRRLATGTLAAVKDITGNLVLNGLKYGLDVQVHIGVIHVAVPAPRPGCARSVAVVSVTNQCQAGGAAAHQGLAREGGTEYSRRVVRSVNALALRSEDSWLMCVNAPNLDNPGQGMEGYEPEGHTEWLLDNSPKFVCRGGCLAEASLFLPLGQAK